MGEKETMSGAAMAGMGGAGRESSAPSVSEKVATASEAGSGQATGRVAAADVDGDGKAGGGISHEDTWESPARVAAADLDGDGAADRQHGDTTGGKSMRESGGGAGGGPSGIAIGDPGVNGNITGTASDGNDAAINNAHSGVKNLDGGGAAGIAIDEPGVQSSRPDAGPGGGAPPPSTDTTIIKSKSNITNN